MIWLLLSTLTGCDTTVPLDPTASAPPAAISGTVVVDGLAAPATVVVLAAHANNPLPPAGTGRPATLTTVTADALTAGDGVREGAYTLTGMPPGDWLLSGFADVDGDFHPTIDALGGATCGDIVGGHLASLTDRTFAAVSTTPGALVDGITVTLGVTLPVERPAFVPLDRTGAPGVAVVEASEQGGGFALRTTAVDAAFRLPDGTPTVTATLTGPYVVDPDSPADGNPLGLTPSARYDVFSPSCDVAFFAEVMDADHDGAPDPHPDIPGVLDIWPRVGLTWLGVPTDTDANGVPDTFDPSGHSGEIWTAPAVVSPLPVLTGELPVGIPVLMSTLEVAWLPLALRSTTTEESACDGTWTDGTCETLITDVAAIPRGAWAITVIASTGQTWTVPNALAGADAVGTADFTPALQGTWLDLR